MSPALVATLLATVQAAVLFTLLLYTAGRDAAGQGIDGRLCLAGIVAGWLLAYARGGSGPVWPAADGINLATSLAATGAAFAPFFLFYLLGGIGAGDVKLMTAVGALTHLPLTLHAMLYTALCGLPLALIVLARRGEMKHGLRRSARSFFTLRYRRNPQTNAHDATADGTADDDGTDAEPTPPVLTIPYGVAIALGTLAAVIEFAVNPRLPLPF